METHTYFLFLLLCAPLLKSDSSQNWTHYAVLDSNGICHLYWNPPEDKRDDSEITFKLVTKAKGYCALGFSPNGGMPGSDIVTGWVKNDGQVYFQDRYADAFSLPPMDPHQDYELISAYENDTCTVFEFRRKLVTCDKNDMPIDESTLRVMCAYSDEDPEFDDPFYHRENRASKSVMLLQSKLHENDDQNLTSLLTWEVRVPDVDISSKETLYWCKIVKTPQVSEKHHIIRVKPAIQPGHEQYVHHILMYECGGGGPEELEEFIDHRGYECNLPNMPQAMQKCEGVTIPWAVGSEGMVFPEHVGLPIYPSPGRYYSLEIHYDNPQRDTGIIDNSGFTFLYTPNLRTYDAGVFMMGSSVSPRIIIPPRQKEYVVVGHTNYDCIGNAFPESGINVFGVNLHSHLLGRDLRARHFRGSTELPPLAEDKTYDFNYQEYRMYPDEFVILPHDQVTVECVYDSSERSQVTLGGSSTKREMCMAFLLYYPAVNQYSSLSMPRFADINKLLKTNITKDSEVYDTLKDYDWKTVNITEFQNAMRYSKQNSRCYFGDRQEDIESLVSYPDDLIPYEKNSTCSE